MTDTIASLGRKIDTAGDLRSVVRTMKALAAANIGQYEQSVRALTDYYRSVELGLSICFRQSQSMPSIASRQQAPTVHAVVFGSDQGLVGRFNDAVADFALHHLDGLGGDIHVWAVGERVHDRLADAGVMPVGLLSVPNSVQAITPLVGEILLQSEVGTSHADQSELHLFHNRPTSGPVYEPMQQRLLPLDQRWRYELLAMPWPSQNLPEIIGGDADTLRALIREYLFVSLFRACAESLASENASRLSAMQRADKNIAELLEGLRGTFHRLRQTGIDEELFDVTSGFEALGGEQR